MIAGCARCVQVLALTLLAAGCTARGEGDLLTVAPVAANAPASAAPAGDDSHSLSDASAAPAPDPSPFHEAVVSYYGHDDMAPNSLRLCPFRGRTYVCGVTDVPLVSTPAGVVEDTTADAASKPLFGQPYAAFGSWPDNAWLVSGQPGSIELHAYRYAHGSWQPFAAFRNVDAEQAAAWRGGLLVNYELFTGPSAGEIGSHLGLVRRNDNTLPGEGDRVGDARGVASIPSPYRLTSLMSVDDALFLAVIKGKKIEVERRSLNAGGRDRVDVLQDLDRADDPATDAQLWVRSANDAVVFGTATRAGKTPVWQHFDGQNWLPTALPAGIDAVVAYDRTSGGAERIFTRSKKVFGLFERTRNPSSEGPDEWRSLALPTLPEGDRIQRVWLANDDAWLLVWPAQHSGRAVHLLRLQPVKKVWVHPDAQPPEGERLGHEW